MAYDGNGSGGSKKSPLINSNLEQVSRKIESISYVDQFLKERNRFLPDVNFYDPANFARFGSAEQYYIKAAQNIYQFYPYDGSAKEKLEWLNGCNYFDLHIFENEYPRTNGYIELGSNWSVDNTITVDGEYYTLSTAPQLINIKGGPHGPSTPTYATSSYDKTISFKELEQKANVFNEARNQKQNLTINGVNGNTVEFWFKFPNDPLGDQQSKNFAYFDLHNGKTPGSGLGANVDYARFTIETKKNSTGGDQFDDNCMFHLTYASGTTGVFAAQLGALDGTTTADVTSKYGINMSEWNHYSFSVENHPTGSDHLLLKLHINGNLVDTVHTGSQVNENKNGPLNAYLGAYKFGQTLAAQVAGIGDQGYGSISGSFDEFRFWTIKRNSDEIKFNWFKQIDGGTNTDYGDFKAKFTGSFSPVNLGVYYKFNEGITTEAAYDANVLDYSGRVSNGVINNYSSSVRSTGSAIVEAGAATTEFKDPIIYDFHPVVSNYIEESIYKGREYDGRNSLNIYNTLPMWILEDDEAKSSEVTVGTVKALTQIIASQFDEIYLNTEKLPSLRDGKYMSGSISGSINRSLPFADKLLTSAGFKAPEIFSNGSVFESLANRNDEYEFQRSLTEVKNQIYTNIYNNLSYINRSKGTEKSIRSIMNCFGIGDNVYSINFYSNNAKLNLNRSSIPKTVEKRYVDFNDKTRRGATVFQMTASSDSNSVSYITGSNATLELPFTVEAEVIFPRKPDYNDPAYSDKVYTELSSSIFGMHQVADVYIEGDSSWNTDDYANFQVYAVKRGVDPSLPEFNQVYFVLTSSNVSATVEGLIPEIKSDVYTDTYDEQKWNFAVKFKPSRYPNIGYLSGSEIGPGNAESDFTIEFIGINTVAGVMQQSFHVSQTISSADGIKIASNSKRLYAGAHRQNYTGSLLTEADTKISSCRFWQLDLDYKEILAHASDPTNFGIFNPTQNAYLLNKSDAHLSLTGDDPYPFEIPKLKTLILNWDFATITGSSIGVDGLGGEFEVLDFSSGSSDSLYPGTIPNVLFEKQHTGRALFFPSENNYSDSISRENVHGLIGQVPENLNSYEMIRVFDDYEKYYGVKNTPIQFSFGIEKSMYQSISEQMISFIAGTIETSGLENAIGEPVNRYRRKYKSLDQLKTIFFDKVSNTPDLDKFIDYYKWLDDSISKMVQQVVPASSEFREITDVVENHLFERPKYASKMPLLNRKLNNDLANAPVEASAQGNPFLTYSWEYGHAPLSGLQSENLNWWKNRAVRSDANLATGIESVDDGRIAIFSASSQTFDRKFNAPYSFGIRRNGSGKAMDLQTRNENGTNDLNYKQAVINQAPPGSLTGISFDTSTFLSQSNVVALDEINPNRKYKTTFKLSMPQESGETFVDGRLYSPITFYSGNFETSILPGYQLTTQHLQDYYLQTKEVPMQGPFTEQNVGGYAYRHGGLRVDVNALGMGYNLKPEAWYAYRATLPSGEIQFTLYNPFDLPGTSNGYPRALFTRDQIAKRPLNIKNIKSTTVSYLPQRTELPPVNDLGNTKVYIGNYSKNYEVVQIPGREINNRYLVRSGSVSTESIPSIGVPSISGAYDWTVPNRGKSEHIIVSKFSAPGGPETSGPSYLDPDSETFSIYNALPYRNLSVRQPLAEFLTHHVAFGGYDSFYTPQTASFGAHKTQRNGIKRIISSSAGVDSEGVISTSSLYDNYWVQHQIPQSDMQYAWITASADSGPFGFSRPDYKNRSLASTDIAFASSSDFGAYETSAGIFIYGTTRAAAEAAGDAFIPIDFVGLNTIAVPDSDSFDENTLFYDTTSPQTFSPIINSTPPPPVTAEGSAATLNGQLLNSNGPYGLPSWKQTRNSYNPIVRYMRKINRLSILKESISSSPGDLKLQKITTKTLVNYTEPPVSFKYKPLNHFVLLKDGSDALLKNTFSNNLCTFTDPKINDQINFYGNSINQQIYQTLKNIFVDKAVSPEFSPVENLEYINYSEVIYPREKNTGLAKTRGRENYTVSSGSADFNVSMGNSRAFWKNNINDRLRSDAEARNAEGLIIASGSSYFGLTDMSIWPLDAEEPMYDLYLISSSDNGAGAYEEFYWAPLSPSGASLDPATQTRFQNVNKNGELSYGGWLYSLLGINLQGKVREDGAPTGSGPIPNFFGDGYIDFGLNLNPTASFQFEFPNMMMSGAYGDNYIKPTASLHLIPPYRTDVLSGKTPWFNSYEDYSEDIRRIAKDYTVIPEFRITDHIDYYLNEGFFADNKKFLDLIGISLNNTSSADSESGVFQDDFFKIYSHSDFMKHFSLIQEDYRKDNTVSASKIRLEANAVKKLLPYQGFYPALRSVQLGQLFSASYAPYITGSNVRDGEQERLAALYQPFFAPGIFFNTIKSGIAVSYPVHTASAPQTDINDYLTAPTPTTASFFVSNQYVDIPNYSFPFESILDPDQYLPVSSSRNPLSSSVYFVNSNFTGSTRANYLDGFYARQTQDYPYDGTGNPSGSYQPQIYFEWKGQSNPKYALATSNFFAEAVDFFLEKGTLTSFISKAEKDFKSMTSGSTYYMDVLLYKTENFVSYEGPSGSFRYDGGLEYSSSVSTATWHSRVSSFGDGLANPWISARGMHYGPSYKAHNLQFGSTGTGSVPYASFRVQDPTYAPHTPPYFYGTSRARIAFKPHNVREMQAGEAAKFTLEEILSNAKVETVYENDNEMALTLQEDLYRNTNAAGIAQMQLSSSVNLFGQITLKEIEYGTERGPDGSYKATRATTPVVQGTNDAWIIETKFECPSINMADMDTASLGAGIGDGKEKYYTRGIWKGYGLPPTGSEGLFLQLKESYPQVINEIGGDNSAELTGSLIDICGFKASKERVGKIRARKTISEAIVAVPIDEKGNFFPIDPKMFQKQKSNYETSNKALMAGDFGVATDIGETSITDMITKMKKFSLPPQMDFLNNPNIDPFIMYIFEFTHSLSKQDLADIWQNLMPEISRTAEKSSVSIEHDVGVNYEFFGQFTKGNLPDNIRWMVFKVKQKARNNFFNVTQQSEVAKGFTFSALKELQGISSNPEAELTYSYNWPYDFFSLVELGQIEASATYSTNKKRKKTTTIDKKTGRISETTTYEDESTR